jgi:hypothetical protein
LEDRRNALQAFDRLERPLLLVSIGGSPVGTRPSSFRLLTDRAFPAVNAHLQFPAESGIGKEGDKLTVSLSYGEEERLLFTGEIYDTGIYGAHRNLALTDGYKKLCDTKIVAAYRKETAGVILQDTLDAAGITEAAITCPEVEIARFSTQEIPSDKIIVSLIKALEEHGHAGLRFFFDEKNIFHFGTALDTGKNEGENFVFESGKNILKKGDGKIEVLPLPIRHTQNVTVDGVPLVAFRTDLHIAGSWSRLVLWLEAAE